MAPGAAPDWPVAALVWEYVVLPLTGADEVRRPAVKRRQRGGAVQVHRKRGDVLVKVSVRNGRWQRCVGLGVAKDVVVEADDRLDALIDYELRGEGGECRLYEQCCE
eukprot:366539-Chlamydomonas_euryale.AAC.3